MIEFPTKSLNLNFACKYTHRVTHMIELDINVDNNVRAMIDHVYT